MNTVSLIRNQTKVAHDWLEATMADVTPDMAHRPAPGIAHPIGSRYAHLAVSEDNLLAMVTKSAPIHSTTWQGKTGIPNPQDAFGSAFEWAQSVKVDLDALRQYKQAVYANTDEYLASLQESALDAEIDLTEWGMGKWSVGDFLVAFLIGHVRDIMGEITAIKGVHGLKGYPF